MGIEQVYNTDVIGYINGMIQIMECLAFTLSQVSVNTIGTVDGSRSVGMNPPTNNPEMKQHPFMDDGRIVKTENFPLVS